MIQGRKLAPEEKSSPRIRGNSEVTVRTAYQMRRDMTPAEKVLWEALRGRKLEGLRFRAQHPAGPYVLDFYCPQYKLVVEVDGGVHEGNREQDAARDQHVMSYGYRVVRFRNEEVMEDLTTVLERITAFTKGDNDAALGLRDEKTPPLLGAAGQNAETSSQVGSE